MQWEMVSNKYNDKSQMQFFLNILKFLQLCCENCHWGLQNCLREQTMENSEQAIQISVNLIETVQNVFMEINNISKEQEGCLAHKNKLLLSTLNTMSDFSLGPCEKNQVFFLSNKVLMEQINNFANAFKKELGRRKGVGKNPANLFVGAIKFLKSLVTGNRDPQSLSNFINYIDFINLIEILMAIHFRKIKPNLKNISTDKICSLHSSKKKGQSKFCNK